MMQYIYIYTYISHVCPPRFGSTGSTLDVKKSSYKKLSKLLSAFEKKGALKIKLLRKQEHVSHVHRDNPLLQNLPGADEATQGAVVAPREVRRYCYFFVRT